MNSVVSYYGSNTSNLVSYLEFGSIDLEKSKKEIWGYCQHQQAYDYYMFSRYAKDLFLFRDFNLSKKHTLRGLKDCIAKTAHDKIMDYIFKFAGVLTGIEKSGGYVRLVVLYLV